MWSSLFVLMISSNGSLVGVPGQCSLIRVPKFVIPSSDLNLYGWRLEGWLGDSIVGVEDEVVEIQIWECSHSVEEHPRRSGLHDVSESRRVLWHWSNIIIHRLPEFYKPLCMSTNTYCELMVVEFKKLFRHNNYINDAGPPYSKGTSLASALILWR